VTHETARRLAALAYALAPVVLFVLLGEHR
jgi:hypothetical protein